MIALLFTLAVGALPERLELAFEQTAGGCALDARLPQSIGRYVPRLSLLPASGEGTWRLSIATRPGEVELVLAEDRGAERLRRVLKAAPDACAATADGIGLILERYLSDLGYRTGFAEAVPPPIETTVETTTATAAATATVQPPTPPAASEGDEVALVESSTRADPTDETGLEVEADLSVAALIEAPSEASVRFGGAVDFGIELLWLRFEIGLLGFAPGSVEALRRGAVFGEYRVGSVGAMLRAGACLDLAPVSLCGLVGGGPEWVFARIADAQLFTDRSTVARGGLIGAGVRADLSLGPILLLFRGETVVRPDRARFSIDGLGIGYRDQRVAGFLSLGVAVKLF